jgi:hypothetical protein
MVIVLLIINCFILNDSNNFFNFILFFHILDFVPILLLYVLFELNFKIDFFRILSSFFQLNMILIPFFIVFYLGRFLYLYFFLFHPLTLN